MITVLILLVSCCSKIFQKEEDFLTISKTSYTGNELKLNGCYYQKWDNNQKFGNVIFLYNNGVVFQKGGSGELKDLNNYLSEIQENKFYYSKKGFWGLFIVEENKIICERWVGTEAGYLVYQEEGNIINDTTFMMTLSSRINKGVKTNTHKIERIYYFHEYSPKPDSTNNFIK